MIDSRDIIVWDLNKIELINCHKSNTLEFLVILMPIATGY